MHLGYSLSKNTSVQGLGIINKVFDLIDIIYMKWIRRKL